MSETPEQPFDCIATEVAEQQKQLNALYATLECGHQQQYAVAGQCLLCQVAEQQREIERLKEEAKTLCARSMKDREEANAATMAARHAADALLWITPEHVSELQSKLRAVEALRDQLSRGGANRWMIPEGAVAAKLTAILTPEAQS